MPPFKITPCTLEDAPAIARNNIAAFWEDEHYSFRWIQKNKDREYAIAQSALRWPYNLTKNRIHRREKAIDVSTGELVGFSSWLLPEATAVEADDNEGGEQDFNELWPEARVPDVDDETRERLKKTFDEANWVFNNAQGVPNPTSIALSSRLKGDNKWIILGSLAVHPDHQRQGVASQLIESGIRAAEKIGLDIFVTGTRAGRGVYLKAGFIMLAELTLENPESGGDGEYRVYLSKTVKK